MARGTRRCSRRLTTSTSLSSMRQRQPLGKSVAKWAMLVPSTSERVCIVLFKRLIGALPALHGKLNDFCFLVDHLKELAESRESARSHGAFPAVFGKLVVEAAFQGINPVPSQRPGSQALVGKEAPPQQPVAVVSQAKWRGDPDWHRERVLLIHGNSTWVNFGINATSPETLTERPVHWLIFHIPQQLATECQSCACSERPGT